MENFEKERKKEILVDTLGAEMARKWQNEGTLYQRKIEPILEAEKVTTPENVETRLPDGTVESVQEANPGDWKITGSKGEVFVFTQEKIGSLYTTDKDGNFIPRERQILAIKNPFGTPIKIQAPWGTKEKPAWQEGNENCMLVVSLDESGQMTNDRYIIGDEETLLSNYDPVTDDKSKM